MVETRVTFGEALRGLPIPAQLRLLHTMVDELASGRDGAIAAVRDQAAAVGANIVLIGGVAVITHGYPRPTQDRDFLVDHQSVSSLAERLWNDPNWERIETSQYAFVHRPTGIQVEFLVSGDLIQLGRPYCFPAVDEVEKTGAVEGVPVIGLHDLLWLKLLAGRMQDLADIMQLCKLHLNDVRPDRVLASLQPEDDDLRHEFLEILKKAPIELANERRLGQGIHKREKPSS